MESNSLVGRIIIRLKKVHDKTIVTITLAMRLNFRTNFTNLYLLHYHMVQYFEKMAIAYSSLVRFRAMAGEKVTA